MTADEFHLIDRLLKPLAEGAPEALGLADDEPVTSPTFTLVHEYTTEPPVAHADLYRLESAMDVVELGLLERRDDGWLLLVEWGTPYLAALGGDALELEFENFPRRIFGRARGRRGDALLSALLEAPSIYDEFLRYLARAGFDVPAGVLERDVTTAHVFTPELVPVFRRIYENASEHWREYEACEEFVDLEDNFQLWRFRHLKTVERIIGHKRGTGGSSGVGFLKRALDLTFFPELYAVRTEIGA